MDLQESNIPSGQRLLMSMSTIPVPGRIHPGSICRDSSGVRVIVMEESLSPSPSPSRTLQRPRRQQHQSPAYTLNPLPVSRTRTRTKSIPQLQRHTQRQKRSKIHTHTTATTYNDNTLHAHSTPWQDGGDVVSAKEKIILLCRLGDARFVIMGSVMGVRIFDLGGAW